MPGKEVRARIQLALVAAVLRGSGKRYVSAREVSRMLGVSTRTAGRILASLEREGYISRWSRRSYKVLAREDMAVHASSESLR